MKRISATLLAGLLALTVLVPIAHAQDHPIFDTSRLSMALGVNHDWYAGSDTESGRGLPSNEFSAGPYIAYNLLAKESRDDNGEEVYQPLLSFAASTTYGFDSTMLQTRVGLRLMLYSGKR